MTPCMGLNIHVMVNDGNKMIGHLSNNYPQSCIIFTGMPRIHVCLHTCACACVHTCAVHAILAIILHNQIKQSNPYPTSKCS